MSPPRQTRRSSDERRLEIADAALRIIATRGIAALTMAELAKEIRVTAGSLFRHFESRDEILEAAAALAVTRLQTSFPEPRGPAQERLRAFITARSALLGSDAGTARLIFSDQFTKALPRAALRAVRAAVQASERFLVETLAQAQREGTVRRDVPARELAPLVMGATLASAFLAQAGGEAPRDLWRTLQVVLAATTTGGRR